MKLTRTAHAKGIPPNSMYMLCCCFQEDCCHPLCKERVGFNIEKVKWFPDGPPVNRIPLPVSDPRVIKTVQLAKGLVLDTILSQLSLFSVGVYHVNHQVV